MAEAKKVRKLLDKYNDMPLSDADVKKLMGNHANIVTYSQIRNYSSIDQLLGPYGVVFILYEWRKGYGHWTVLTKHKNLLEFFNPYGGMPDDELDNVNPDLRKELGEDHPYLSDLLRKCKYDLSYNEFQFQRLDHGIKTCGKWCVIRAYLKDLDLYDFQKLFHDMYADDLVSILTR